MRLFGFGFEVVVVAENRQEKRSGSFMEGWCSVEIGEG